MVKRKNRAARRDQRKRAEKAEQRGLPAALEAAPPPKARRVRGDVAAAALASDSRPRGQRASMVSKPAATGLPVFAKVLMGAAVALLVVYALSQFRKSGSATLAQDQDVSAVETTTDAGAGLVDSEVELDAPQVADPEPPEPSSENADSQETRASKDTATQQVNRAEEASTKKNNEIQQGAVAPPLELTPPAPAPRLERAPAPAVEPESAAPSEGQPP